MSGWISIQRKIREHWIWQDPVKLKWWLDILLTVNHTSSKVNIGMQLFDCEKGQSIMSLQSWAEKWGVSKDTTRNFFVLLEKDGMISTENLKKTTRLTVCNYETYQSGLHDEQTPSERKPNAEQTQAGTNNKYKQGMNKVNNIIPENFKLFDEVKNLFDPKFYNEKKWIKCYDELIRIDNYSEENILQIVKHFRADNFWSGNFQTLPKLRTTNKEGTRYIDVFAEKLKNVKSQNNGNKSGKQEPDLSDNDRYIRAAGTKVY